MRTRSPVRRKRACRSGTRIAARNSVRQQSPPARRVGSRCPQSLAPSARGQPSAPRLFLRRSAAQSLNVRRCELSRRWMRRQTSSAHIEGDFEVVPRANSSCARSRSVLALASSALKARDLRIQMHQSARSFLSATVATGLALLDPIALHGPRVARQFRRSARGPGRYWRFRPSQTRLSHRRLTAAQRGSVSFGNYPLAEHSPLQQQRLRPATRRHLF